MRRVAATLALILTAGLTAGHADAATKARGARAVAAPWPAELPVYDHVVIVVEENKDYGEIIGNAAAPYINGVLKAEGASFTRMFGEEQKEINEEVKDAVGELTNVISGDSRRRLEEIGHHFLGAVPSVISGQGHEVKHITKGPILSIPFSTPGGNFTVEVCFK